MSFLSRILLSDWKWLDSYAGVAYENRPSVEDQGNTVLNTFKKIADEIVSGYADGSRVRFVEDSSVAL